LDEVPRGGHAIVEEVNPWEKANRPVDFWFSGKGKHRRIAFQAWSSKLHGAEKEGGSLGVHFEAHGSPGGEKKS